MRLFLGIKASKDLQIRIKRWQDENLPQTIRLIKLQNLHLTLVPPWKEETSDNSVLKLKAINFKYFWIVYDRMYVNYRNGVIWIESSIIPKELLELRSNVADILNKKEEKRAFKAHITIARFKDRNAVKGVVTPAINWREKCGSITLFESKLNPKGAEYKEIFTKTF